VLLAHYLLAFREMLERDARRLGECLGRVNVMPLGSAALAGTSLPLDRKYTAKLLGFRSIAANSMDAVSDQDFVAEFIFDAGLLMMHLSRFCEDLIIWSSGEFGFVEISDAYTTGSSIMPQKRNPDSMELVRGKSGRMVGNLVALLVTSKGLPSTYDKDLQEDKEPLFDTLDTLNQLLPIVTGVLATLEVNGEAMRQALGEPMLATDLADYLVRRGVPFRQAHHLVGRAVRRSEERGVSLSKLTLGEYTAISPVFGQDIYAVLDMETSVEARSVRGGTARAAIEEQIARANELLDEG